MERTLCPILGLTQREITEYGGLFPCLYYLMYPLSPEEGRTGLEQRLLVCLFYNFFSSDRSKFPVKLMKLKLGDTSVVWA